MCVERGGQQCNRAGIKDGGFIEKLQDGRFPGDDEVNRPHGRHDQNTGEQVGDSKFHVEDPGDRTGGRARQKSQNAGDPWIDARGNESGGDAGAQRESPVHRKIGKVQNLIGDENPQRHKTVDKALPQHRLEQTQEDGHSSSSFLRGQVK
ncbi:hypothetical protein SDC9_119596 [bioreactor metagenome]|uniref:Uncharacterized protein n=1 Tax=bioreactor metagenome TaxID=1076179 RepID=A0A645C4C2_9ZZZZ